MVKNVSKYFLFHPYSLFLTSSFNIIFLNISNILIVPQGSMSLQVEKLSWDGTTNDPIPAYFLSRISLTVLTDIGATFETAWATVKRSLREKY